MDDMQLLIDLHIRQDRQGPGSDAETRRALDLARVDPAAPLRAADIGCGTGAAALTLAAQLPHAQITALDFLPPFLDVLAERARERGLGERISPLVASMEALPFAPESLDLIWSEGAVYNLGFARGVRAWRRFLKPGGRRAVSEITWTTARRPREIQDYWTAAYPEIDTAGAKIRILMESGYTVMGYFTLPPACWLGQYYRPLQAGVGGLRGTGAARRRRRSRQPRNGRFGFMRRMGRITAMGSMRRGGWSRGSQRRWTPWMRVLRRPLSGFCRGSADQCGLPRCGPGYGGLVC